LFKRCHYSGTVRYAVAEKAVDLFEDVKGLGWTAEGADELS
jgi:hypothetical protein